MGRFKSVLESTDVETHFSMKFRGILRPKSVRRTLVVGLIYGPRANKQFDIAFWVFWTWPGPIGHSDSLIFKPRWLCQQSSCWCKCPAQGTLSFIGPAPGHFLLCKNPGAGHTFRCRAGASGCRAGGMVTSQIDTCITCRLNLIGCWSVWLS